MYQVVYIFEIVAHIRHIYWKELDVSSTTALQGTAKLYDVNI